MGGSGGKTPPWGVRERSFLRRLNELTLDEIEHVKRVVTELMHERPLPHALDIPDIIDPCFPAYRRQVPYTNLWIVYEVDPVSNLLTLSTIRRSQFYGDQWEPDLDPGNKPN